MPKRLAKSIRRHIRRQKSAIRRRVSDPAVQAKEIRQLYGKFNVAPRSDSETLRS